MTPATLACESDRLDTRLAENRLDAGDVRRVAARLALHHHRAEPAPQPHEAAGPTALARRIRNVVEELRASRPGLEPEQLVALEERQRRFLVTGVNALRERVAKGYIRMLPDGLCAAAVHLDSRSVRLTPGGAAVARDVCEDVARICVELSRQHRGGLAEALLAAYCGETNDYASYDVVDFYERHEACQHAVAAGRRAQAGNAAFAEQEAAAHEVQRFARLAVASGRQPLVPPVVVAVGGLVASGKSTISAALAERLAAPRVVGDRVRHALLEKSSAREVHEAAWERALGAGFDERVYDAMLSAGAHVVASGRPLVLDACFPRVARRAQAAVLAAAHGVPFLFVECHVSPEATRLRLAARSEADRAGPEAWRQLFEALRVRWEPVAEGAHPLLRLDGELPVEESLALLETRLPSWPENFPD